MDEKDNEAANSALPRTEIRSAKGTTKHDHHDSFEAKSSMVDITDHGRRSVEYGVVLPGIQVAQSDSDDGRRTPSKSTKLNRESNVSDQEGDFTVLIKANMHLGKPTTLP